MRLKKILNDYDLIFLTKGEEQKLWGSWNMRALQIGNIFANKYNLKVGYFIYNDLKKYTYINATVIAIKCLPTLHLRCKYKKLIVDVVDYQKLLNIFKRTSKLKLYKFIKPDVIIFPNYKSLCDYKKYLKNTKIVFIDHHYDKTYIIESNNNNYISLGYFGNIVQLPDFIKKKDNIIINDRSKLKEVNVHINIRNPKDKSFHYKPSTKTSFAAACQSIIITLPEPSIIYYEFMSDYPYFMKEYSENEFNRVYNLILDTFKKDTYYLAKHKMKLLKQETELENIITKYIDIILPL